MLCAVAKSSTNLFSPAATSLYITEDELQEARKSREDVEAGILLTLAGTVRFQKPKNPESIWTAIAATGKWMQVSMEHSRSSISKEGVAEVIIALGQNEGVMKVWTGLIGAPPSRGTRIFVQGLELQTLTGKIRLTCPICDDSCAFHPDASQRELLDIFSFGRLVQLSTQPRAATAGKDGRTEFGNSNKV